MNYVLKIVLAVFLVGAETNQECVQKLKISASTATKTSFVENSKKYLVASYGDDITVFCSSDDTVNLAIESDGDYPVVNKLNDTTIQSIRQHDVGEYEYICTKNETDCKSSLTVIVAPHFSVNSPRVHNKPDEGNRWNAYFVPRGEDYEILCMGTEPTIYDDSNYKWLQTESVNLTTVKLKATANKSAISFYYCISNGYRDKGKSRRIKLIVDFYPEGYNFLCTSFGLHWRKLECSWVSSTKKNLFKLFLVETNGIKHLLCSYDSGSLTKTCHVDNTHGSGSLMLQTCNEVFCVNKTYAFGPNSIVKLESPSELMILNRSDSSAVIKWYSKFAWDGTNMYKVEYRMLAGAWREANSSAIQIPRYSDYCTLQLALPCPDTHYEVRVFVKDKAALEDRFWSEPTPSLYFFTDALTDDVDSVCSAALQDPEPIMSVETAMAEIGKLIRQTTKEKKVLRRKVSNMRKKLAQIRSLKEL